MIAGGVLGIACRYFVTIFFTRILQGEDDYSGHLFTISKLEELIDYLNEEMVSAMHGEMPLEWFHEQDSLDYEDEIREYLLQNYSEQIDKMGWDSNNL